jgi:hypothetical protein
VNCLNFPKLLSLVALALVFLGTVSQAEEPFPHVHVIARAADNPFKNLVSQANMPRLLSAVAEEFAKTARLVSPCMEWGSSDSESRKPSAQLALVFERVTKEGSEIQLSFKATFGANPEQSLNKLSRVVISPLKEAETPSGFDRVLKILSRKIDLEVHSDEFLNDLNLEFIRHVPLASTVQFDDADKRVIVPVNSTRLRLSDGSRISLEFDSKLCTSLPERCEVTLLSLGPSPVHASPDFLRCRPEGGSTCCGPLKWDSVRKIQSEKNKRVFLGPHKHCPFFQASCRSDGVSLSLSISQKEGS